MMLQQLFGTELAFPIRVAVALAVIATLLGVTVLAMRRLGARNRAAGGRGRAGPRIAVVETVAVDQRRKLVLVRRDQVEHLLLIGGSSDIVVEPQIMVQDEGAAAGLTPPAGGLPLPPGRDAPALQRPARRGIPAAAAPAALAMEPPAATLPPPPPAAEAAAPAPAEIQLREERRPIPGRRPLPRGDGTLSGQSPQRPGLVRPAAAASTPPAPAAEGAPALPRAEAPRLLHGGEPRAAAIPEPAPQPKAEAPTAPPAAPRFDAMAQRLDAALTQPAPQPATPPAPQTTPTAPAPAAPQLSLSDLLGDLADAPEAPAVEPPPERPVERALSRFAAQPRGRTTELRSPLEPRPRLDPVPRIDRPREETSVRAGATPRAEPPMRPREFAFRPSPAHDAAPALRDAPARDLSARGIEAALKDALPKTSEPAAPDDAPRPAVETPAVKAEPLLSATRGDDALPVAPPVPEGEAPAAADPLDDFDAEMANLLGRSTARGR
ncbi:flagellar biosynthetic protein FliO [Xanthobacter sp. AM11]|uniref:flagellar biosynthetic protein FliO n=1 Tax=Xanthobacter sp. AM11 TaxID=3380643 RepID=UPI0039BFF2BD